MILSNSALMRAADDTAINGLGIASTALMENAAGHLAEAARGLARGQSAYIFCGSGNNGGDGVAAAAYLLRAGFEVRVLLCGRRTSMTADTREMERRLNALGGAVEDFDPDEDGLAARLNGAGVIIDAIFGIGLNREVGGPALEAIRLINAAKAPVVSADIPSGVDADTGRIMGAAVCADVTVTFSMAKAGQFAEPGCTCCGAVEVRDIGIPQSLLEQCGTGVSAMTDGEMKLPRRNPLSHKGDYGRILIAGGCAGYTGAPTLCAR
ncbi:MAG: NAD(P)H-hydrate epimerase, partial [Butyricicoccus sp.]|nr:NAD(P)H-hydrate epimerase [Butyricicoccus sp.]